VNESEARQSGAREEQAADGGVLGNVYGKYETRNPIARWLMNGFLESVGEFYASTSRQRVLEVGCGEGLLADHLIGLASPSEHFEATDVRLSALEDGVDERIVFREASVYSLPYADASFDLVVCCEVLEHLEDPSSALAEIARVTSGPVLFSTPREPLWRILNMARGRYIGDAGNTPGHIQHWSRSALVELIASKMRVVEVRSPIPWTVVLAEASDGG
jgi:2-polyprenyl-3-methyl-5-hydroxy-6-metoxy-1,4-benzoquinol methylase